METIINIAEYIICIYLGYWIHQRGYKSGSKASEGHIECLRAEISRLRTILVGQELAQKKTKERLEKLKQKKTKKPLTK